MRYSLFTHHSKTKSIGLRQPNHEKKYSLKNHFFSKQPFFGVSFFYRYISADAHLVALELLQY